MSRKQKYRSQARRIVILSFISVFVVVTVILLFAIDRHYKDTPPQQSTPTNSQPQFTFDQAKAPNWMVGANDDTGVSIARKDFFSSKEQTCIIYIFIRKGEVSPSKKIKSYVQFVKQKVGVNIVTDGVKSAILDTSYGPQKYKLYQFINSGASESGSRPFSTEERGYLPLDKGYLDIWVHCMHPEQLPSTVAALHALRYVPNK